MSALNILLVDDNQNLVTALSHELYKAMGKTISVSVCFSDAKALSMLATRRFDVVISDFNIPSVSGLALLSKIRQDYRETILVLITAYGTEALEEEVHRLRIGYITRPFGLPLLVQFIHDLIRGEQRKDGPENATRIQIRDPKGKAGMP